MGRPRELNVKVNISEIFEYSVMFIKYSIFFNICIWPKINWRIYSHLYSSQVDKSNVFLAKFNVRHTRMYTLYFCHFCLFYVVFVGAAPVRCSETFHHLLFTKLESRSFYLISKKIIVKPFSWWWWNNSPSCVGLSLVVTIISTVKLHLNCYFSEALYMLLLTYTIDI